MAIKEMLERAQAVKPIAEVDGVKIVSFEDYRDTAIAEKVEGNGDIGVRTLNPDGTVAASYHRYSAVNPELWFSNRFKKDGKKLKVVTDYRAIKEQDTGRIYSAKVIAYVIERIEGNLVCTGAEYTTDEDFIKSYTHKLDIDGASDVFKAISKYQNSNVSVGAEKLMI